MLETVTLIPKERIAVLIGTKGVEKKRLQRLGNCKINIDSNIGEITISTEDPIALINAEKVVEAIGRGFSPRVSHKLFKEDYNYLVIPIESYARSRKRKIDLKGRIIGAEGRSRRTIEYLTGTNISVYGKTVAIIGKHEELDRARRAVEMLLAGAPHQKVFDYLKRVE